MNVEGILTKNVRIDVDPINVVKSLFEHYFHHDYNDINKMEDGLYYEYDVSMHGSPQYQYELITKDQNLIDLFEGLVKVYHAQIQIQTKEFLEKKNK